MPEFVVMLTTLVGSLLMLIGCVFLFAGGVGLIRLPDLYTRVHAAGVTDTGSTIFMLLLLLILFFTLFTTPTSSHALAKTALLSGLVPSDEHGKPLLSSPQLARQLALSRVPDGGTTTIAAGVDEEHCDVVDQQKIQDTEKSNDRGDGEGRKA